MPELLPEFVPELVPDVPDEPELAVEPPEDDVVPMSPASSKGGFDRLLHALIAPTTHPAAAATPSGTVHVNLIDMSRSCLPKIAVELLDARGDETCVPPPIKGLSRWGVAGGVGMVHDSSPNGSP